VGNSIKCLSQGHSNAIPHRESIPALYQLSHAAAAMKLKIKESKQQ